MLELVDPHEIVRTLAAVGEAQDHRRAKEHAFTPILGRIHDDRRLDVFVEPAETSIDLPQPLLPVDVLSVLRAVAHGRGPGQLVDDVGAFTEAQTVLLGAKSCVASRRDVVLELAHEDTLAHAQ